MAFRVWLLPAFQVCPRRSLCPRLIPPLAECVRRVDASRCVGLFCWGHWPGSTVWPGPQGESGPGVGTVVQSPRTCVAGSLCVPLGAGDTGPCLSPARRTLRPVSSHGNGSPDALATAAISRHLLWPAQLSLRLCLFDSQGSTALRLAGGRQPVSGGLASVPRCAPGWPTCSAAGHRSPSRGTKAAVDTTGGWGLQWRVSDALPACQEGSGRGVQGSGL